jgi:glucose-6-phosphate dehydrogenase assembly protein OpcA
MNSSGVMGAVGDVPDKFNVVLRNNEVQKEEGEQMATETSPDQGKRLPWAGKPVRPEHIENELTFLWHLAADNMRISQNMNVRTSVLNLVICALDIASAYEASALLRDLPNTHIARVILVILDTRGNLPSGATTWVTLRSFPVISDIMRHHFEQVTVLLSGKATQSAPTLLQPLLKPDLPVYLWWVSDLPSNSEIFQRLITISNRVIVDSSEFSLPEERIRTLSSVLQASPNCALSDFSWSRITPWRELVAQFFDVAEYRPYMVNIEKIEIEHAVPAAEGQSTVGKASANPIPALLLAAWLKTCLGWQLSEEDSQHSHESRVGTYFWHMTTRVPTNALSESLASGNSLGEAGSRVIDIIIRPRVQAELLPGNICLIRLTSSFDGKQAVFTINRGDDDEHVITSVEAPDNPCPQRVVNIAATHKAATLLNDELEIMGHDHLYEQTLHEVFSLLEGASYEC